MATGEDWSRDEVRATVLDYMAMLQFELAGQIYNKTAHRQALLTRLAGRSEAAVELKHQNISAVLQDMGHFWISGYKPRSNYQRALAEEIVDWVRQNPLLDQHASAAAEAPASTPEHVNYERFQVGSPVLGRPRGFVAADAPDTYGQQPRVARIRDYAAREAHNSSLGRAGEELVVKFEQYRLTKAGLNRLAEKVEHVSKTQGDGLGFDVLSFTESGAERFIEVKTTTFAREMPFFASSSEIRFAQRCADRFSLYRLFEFRKSPKCFELAGPIEAHCALDPVSYRCSFR